MDDGRPPADGAPVPLRRRTIWHSTTTRVVVLIALTVVIVVDLTVGDHPLSRVAGISVLCLFWVVNAAGVVRRLRRRPR